MTNVIGKVATDYDRERLGTAVERAAMANRMRPGDAANFARRVVDRIDCWLADKTEITGQELRLQTASALATYDPDTAYLYENEKRLF